MVLFLYLVILFSVRTLAVNIEEDTGTAAGAGYAMYVWTNGFDRTVSGCDENEFLKWNSHGKCFTHTWDSATKRQWLWDTCNVPGREVSAIFLSGFHHILQNAYDSKDCNTSEIQMVRQTLTEGHAQVPGLKIYGLFAVDDRGVSEQNLVKYIVYYNDVCARSQSEKLDGVATNNEKYAEIKCADDVTRVRYLDNLKNIVTEARKQRHGRLLTHYSVSWHWGQCPGGNNMITWNHKTQNASLHMIDIFDSIDVQVGYIIFPEIARRLKLAGYDYARTLGKRFYATFYTDKTSPCQITFFPQSCHVHGHTEAGLFKVIDGFSANDISYAKPCIHYFRGVYSSGGNPNWPKHSRTGNGQPTVVG